MFSSFSQLMKLMAVRRAQLANSGRSEVPLPPAPPPHPGYAPNAALHAIKRHAQEFAAPKAAAVSWLSFFESIRRVFAEFCRKKSNRAKQLPNNCCR